MSVPYFLNKKLNSSNPTLDNLSLYAMTFLLSKEIPDATSAYMLLI